MAGPYARQPLRQAFDLHCAAHIAGGDRTQFAQRVALLQRLQIPDKPLFRNNAAIERLIMGRIAEQHRRHRQHAQTMLFNRRNRDAVADAAIDYLRLHGDDIHFRRPAFVVKEH